MNEKSNVKTEDINKSTGGIQLIPLNEGDIQNLRDTDKIFTGREIFPQLIELSGALGNLEITKTLMAVFEKFLSGELSKGNDVSVAAFEHPEGHYLVLHTKNTPSNRIEAGIAKFMTYVNQLAAKYKN